MDGNGITSIRPVGSGGVGLFVRPTTRGGREREHPTVSTGYGARCGAASLGMLEGVLSRRALRSGPARASQPARRSRLLRVALIGGLP